MQSFSDIIEIPNKEPAGPKTSNVVKGKFHIKKSNDDKRLAFGWASISENENGDELVDLSGDIIEPDVLENAAYNFVRFYREGGEMHERGGCAELVESMVFTPEKCAALGIPEGTLPVGWWIGFYVTDDAVWEKVKSGEYPMFSIEGVGVREDVKENDNDTGTQE